MGSTLIIITFADEARAENVFHALGAMRRREFYNLDDSILVSRSLAGEVTIGALGTAGWSARRHAVEVLARLLVVQADSDDGLPVDIGTDFQRVGIDQHFINATACTMKTEFSALFFLIHADAHGHATELGNVLSLFRGQIARTTLTPQACAYLETSH